MFGFVLSIDIKPEFVEQYRRLALETTGVDEEFEGGLRVFAEHRDQHTSNRFWYLEIFKDVEARDALRSLPTIERYLAEREPIMIERVVASEFSIARTAGMNFSGDGWYNPVPDDSYGELIKVEVPPEASDAYEESMRRAFTQANIATRGICVGEFVDRSNPDGNTRVIYVLSDSTKNFINSYQRGPINRALVHLQLDQGITTDRISNFRLGRGAGIPMTIGIA